jgi:AcrR family transcriptional regulator
MSPSKTDSPVKPKRLSGEKRRETIITAARDSFMLQGFSGTRTKDIADRAGVTEAFLYRHFASKEDMYWAAILNPLIEGFESLADDLAELGAQSTDPIDFVQAMNERCLSFFLKYAPLITVALYSELGNGRDFYTGSLRPILDRIGTVVTDSVGWGERGLDPTIVRRAILGAQWAIGLDYMIRHRTVDVEDVATSMTRMFTTGVIEKD